MIVLLLSVAEAQSLIDRSPDRSPDLALCAYIAREMQMEKLLPDHNLPNAVILRGLELDDSQRHYIASVRTFATCEAADRAWADDEDRISQATTAPASRSAVRSRSKSHGEARAEPDLLSAS